MSKHDSTQPDLRVIKLGGSLLEIPNLKEIFFDWINKQPPARNIVIVGGGLAADKVRKQNELRQLDLNDAHWLCIDAMSRNSELVAKKFEIDSFLSDYTDLKRLLQNDSTLICIFDPMKFLAKEEPYQNGTKLEIGWHVTSDSIAARVAEVLGASHLVLLKSSLPDSNRATISELIGSYVDEFFPAAAASIPQIRCVNLRSKNVAELWLAYNSKLLSKL